MFASKNIFGKLFVYNSKHFIAAVYLRITNTNRKRINKGLGQQVMTLVVKNIRFTVEKTPLVHFFSKCIHLY